MMDLWIVSLIVAVFMAILLGIALLFRLIPRWWEDRVIVAGYDASLLTRLMADFVCDGVDDQVEIQAAINMMDARGGGFVILAKGEFNITRGRLDGHRSVTVRPADM